MAKIRLEKLEFDKSELVLRQLKRDLTTNPPPQQDTDQASSLNQNEYFLVKDDTLLAELDIQLAESVFFQKQFVQALPLFEKIHDTPAVHDKLTYYMTTCRIENLKSDAGESDLKDILSKLTNISRSSAYYGKILVNMAICHFKLKNLSETLKLLKEADPLFAHSVTTDVMDTYSTLKKYIMHGHFRRAVELYGLPKERTASYDHFKTTAEQCSAIIGDATRFASLQADAHELKFLSLLLSKKYEDITTCVANSTASSGGHNLVIENLCIITADSLSAPIRKCF